MNSNENEIKCPFCKKVVTEEFEPMEVKNAIGTKYICYKKICRNIAGHWNNSNVIIPYNK